MSTRAARIPVATKARPRARRKPVLKIGRAGHGRRLTLDEFIKADFQEGWLHELARGRVVVTQVLGINHGLIVMRQAA